MPEDFVANYTPPVCFQYIQFFISSLCKRVSAFLSGMFSAAKERLY